VCRWCYPNGILALRDEVDSDRTDDRRYVTTENEDTIDGKLSIVKLKEEEEEGRREFRCSELEFSCSLMEQISKNR
jgi:hypothetical protein